MNVFYQTAEDGLADTIKPRGAGRMQTKTTLMEDGLRRLLTSPLPADEVMKCAKSMGVSKRTLDIAKKNLGVISEKSGGQWSWKLPDEECKDV